MKLALTSHGAGPTQVALVHGLGGEGATWKPLTDLLVADGRFTVTALDMRGHGSSPRSASYVLDDLADDLVASLPSSLDIVFAHSLGGSVLVRAVERLHPARAIYLDPGFRLPLPTTGIGGRLFWLAPRVALGFAQIAQARRTAARIATYTPEVRALLTGARARFDTSMAVGVFRDVAFHPVPVEPPAVPSTIVLSDESPAVLPQSMAAALQDQGWDVRRLTGIGHDMQLEGPDRVLATIDDLLG
jgi:pimeloyl-ACP methyl ester carboxylesterase